MGVEQKREERMQRFYKGGQAGSRGGCLKNEGAGTPVQTMHYSTFPIQAQPEMVQE